MSRKLDTKHHPPDSIGMHRVGGPQLELHRDSGGFIVNDNPQSANTTLDQPQCVRVRSPQRDLVESDSLEGGTSNILITVLMPCLNEARTLAACIQQAHASCKAALLTRNVSRHGLASDIESALQQSQDGQSATTSVPDLTYEILIADNGSEDGSQQIAAALGAKVIDVKERGYGAALWGGILAARGCYVLTGNADASYDFGEVPRFLAKLEDGYDLVIGNRFRGGIMPGAMPWHHRWIGNPVLSGIGRLLFRTSCEDWHCGLRAFRRDKILGLQLRSPGMEFASEMVIRASINGLRVGETPILLHPDGRGRPPHLRSFRDGASSVVHGFQEIAWEQLMQCLIICLLIGVVSSNLISSIFLFVGCPFLFLSFRMFETCSPRATTRACLG